MKTSNRIIETNWVRKESFSNRSEALNKSNRLGLLAGKTSKVEFDEVTKLYWLFFLTGKPIEYRINHSLEEHNESKTIS